MLSNTNRTPEWLEKRRLRQIRGNLQKKAKRAIKTAERLAEKAARDAAEKSEALRIHVEISEAKLKEKIAGRTESRCSKCEQILPPSEFWVNRLSKTGCQARCKKCSRAAKAAYYLANAEQKRAEAKHYRDSNKELIRQQRKARYLLLKQNPYKWKKFMEGRLAYINNKLRNNVQFRLLAAARNRLYYVTKGIGAKRDRTVRILGCTPDFLRSYLEAKFKPGWTWEDWGSVFEIDHIRPCSSFDMTDPEQVKQCFHYTNLQPLDKQMNREKWNKIIAA